MTKVELEQFLSDWLEEQKKTSDLAKMCDPLMKDLADDLYAKIDRLNGIITFKNSIIKEDKKKQQRWFNIRCKMRMLLEDDNADS